LRQRQLESTLVLVTSRAEGITRLEEGSVDGYASDKLLLVGALLEKRPGLTVLADDLSFEPYAITLPRGDWALRLAVNRALAEIYRSGEILRIFDKWFGGLAMRPTLLLGAAYLFGQI